MNIYNSYCSCQSQGWRNIKSNCDKKRSPQKKWTKFILYIFTFYILQLFLFSSQPRVVDTAGPPSPQNGLAGKTEVKKTSNSKEIKNDCRPSHRGKVCIPPTNSFHIVNHSQLSFLKGKRHILVAFNKSLALRLVTLSASQ